LGDTGPLEAGDVVTIEPGIYIPEEGIGVRIEDVILITDTGYKLMSAALPREMADVERAMAKDAVVR
jgi:Xaa-Pro aminopeptidase